MARKRLSSTKVCDLPEVLVDAAQSLSFAYLQALADYIEDKVAADAPDDTQEPARDRLFARIMARVDVLQEHRPALLALTARLRSQPWHWPAATRIGSQVAKDMLADSGLLATDRRRGLQVIGLSAVLAVTMRAWENDTSADLSATMRAADTVLRRAGTGAAWLGFADLL